MLLILLAALLLSSQQASMECIDTGINIASVQTQPFRGPNGIVAALKISSADDHSKNSHGCSAKFQLLVTSSASSESSLVDLLTSDGEYNRTLSARLNGFSRDGKRLFGILSESGKFPSTTLLDYTVDGRIRLVGLEHIAGGTCRATFDVIGTTENGSIVVELRPRTGCPTTGRWLVASNGARIQPLPKGEAILRLYDVSTSLANE